MSYQFGSNNQGQNYGFGQNSQAGGSPFIIVSNVEDVEKAVVQPNETKWFMIQNDTAIAVKTASSIGYSNTEYYRLTKFVPAVLQPPKAGSEYVTTDQLKDAISQIVSQLQAAPPAPTTSKSNR